MSIAEKQAAMGVILNEGKGLNVLSNAFFLRLVSHDWVTGGFMDGLDLSLNKNELVVQPEERSTWTRLQENVVNPALNSSVIEMWNLVASGTNVLTEKISGKALLPHKHELPVAHAEFLSTPWLVQSVSSGLAMLLPYTVAGRATNSLLKSTGSRLGVSAETAHFLDNEALSSILGAAAYDGMREVKPGETRAGNAIGGAAAFGTFALGGELSKNMSVRNMLMVRTLAGAVGGVAQHAVLGWSNNRLPSLEEFGRASVNGMVMSIVLPEAQRGLKTLATKSNETLKFTAPIERFYENGYHKKPRAPAEQRAPVAEQRAPVAEQRPAAAEPRAPAIEQFSPHVEQRIQAPEIETKFDFFVKNETAAAQEPKPERNNRDEKRDKHASYIAPIPFDFSSNKSAVYAPNPPPLENMVQLMPNSS